MYAQKLFAISGKATRRLWNVFDTNKLLTKVFVGLRNYFLVFSVITNVVSGVI